jgi:hypothetical protein
MDYSGNDSKLQNQVRNETSKNSQGIVVPIAQIRDQAGKKEKGRC